MLHTIEVVIFLSGFRSEGAELFNEEVDPGDPVKKLLPGQQIEDSGTAIRQKSKLQLSLPQGLPLLRKDLLSSWQLRETSLFLPLELW